MRKFKMILTIAITVVSCSKKIDAPDGDNWLKQSASQSDFVNEGEKVDTKATETKFQNNDVYPYGRSCRGDEP